MIKALLVSLLMVLLAGCVTTPQGTELSASGKILVQEGAGIAVRRYLRERPGAVSRVERIRKVVELASQATEVTTIGDLKALVIAEVEKTTDPLDRGDALALVNILYAVLLEYVGGDKLDIHGLVKVNEVLGYVLAALPK